MKSYFRTLTIAGSDSGGGAGIQADMKTFSALGCFGMSVVTALTAQNTKSVNSIFPVPPEFIGEQMDAVMEDIGVDAVKIGMLHSAEVIALVADKLDQWDCPNIVLDPVMVSKSAHRLLKDDAVEALKTLLIPKADIITPNLPEASVLLDQKVETLEDMPSAAKTLFHLGCSTILLKGGHLEDREICDVLYSSNGDSLLQLPKARVDTPNSHGTGCTLSSAVCAFLARQLPMEAAVKKAEDYIAHALAAGAAYRIGHGHGPVHHFHALWQEKG
ncbi:MAG: bifunctional hydroxymethylpyrimidine kinase/phosphomethylpyrimidine kinase [Thermodesulfobacteriota bacterium]|nr:bifunctional hydroxymethylpyrimidine kinase/phosphomethylpyrimidine kinase [Thermodesulfobacteriota bacterium]